jgi:hypothetical protein
MGDDPRAEARAALLAEAGWDAVAAGAEVTLPEGGISGWIGRFLEGQVAMTPIRNEDRLAVSTANGTLVLDAQTYGDDVLVTTVERLEDAPLSLVAFLTGTIGALRDLADPATDTDLFAAAVAEAMVMGPGIQGGWVNDVDDLRPWDGSLGDPTVGDGLGELDAFAAGQLGWVPLPIDILALDTLHAAQDALGMAAAPELPVLDAPASATIRIATPGEGLSDRAPLALAVSAGAFEAAGVTDVVLSTGDGLAGILDGSLDLAVVSAADAAAAIAAGDPVVIVAGYQASATEPTVLIAAAERSDTDLAPAVQALLRGLAALHHPDAAVTAAGGGLTADDEAAWPSIVAAFAPFDGSTADAATPIHPALAAARASVGLSDAATQ